MAAITDPQIQANSRTGVGQGPVARWLLPSFFDFLVLSIPAWLFFSGGAGFSRLLLDGDTGWHIRVGQWILEHGQVPRTDFFSFSKPGEPWFAWEWLADVGFGLLMQVWGMKGVLWWSAVLFVLFAALLLGHMVWRGAHIFIVLPLLIVGAGVSTMHLLARPHLYTLVFLPLSLWIAEADRRRPTPWLWSLIPLTVLWTNLHGGWLSGAGSLAILAAGSALEAWLGERPWRAARRLALASGGCFAASMLNPYGWHLHLHTAAYLGNDWIKQRVQEFQSPDFRGEVMMQFEILLFAGLLMSGILLMRKRFAEPLLLLFWAHQSLASGRHALLFVIVLLPVLAEQLAIGWRTWTRGAKRNSLRGILDGIAADSQPALRRVSVWPAAAALLVLTPLAGVRWPESFPPERFPIAMAEQYRELFARKRTLTDDDWADYLLFANYPGQRVFFDGRSDFYGRALGDDFLAMMQGSWRWERLLEQYGIEAALLAPSVPLASLLKQSPEWLLLKDGGQALVFERRGREGKRAEGALMETARSAE